MQWRELDKQNGRRTCALVLETGDEVMQTLQAFAQDQRLQGSHFTALGAFRRATVAFFDWESKQYWHIQLDEQDDLERRTHVRLHEVPAMRGPVALAQHDVRMKTR